MQIFPEQIKTIAVIALSGIPDLEKIKLTEDFLLKKGYKIKIMPSVYKRTNISYLASNIGLRVTDLHRCWEDKSIDLIIAARGGFGSAHLLDLIDWDLLKSRRVSFLGYSDLTALHCGMYSKGITGMVSGPMFQNIGTYSKDSYSLKSLYDSLNWNKPYEINHLPNKYIRIIKDGKTSASIIPVTLSVLVTLLGTKFMPSIKGKILLVEDINEPVYKIDRYMTQLEQCGVLKGLKGLFFGSFFKCGTEKERFLLFKEVAKDIDGPVIWNIPFGHIYPRISVPFGAKCSIDTYKSSIIKVLPPKNQSV